MTRVRCSPNLGKLLNQNRIWWNHGHCWFILSLTLFIKRKDLICSQPSFAHKKETTSESNRYAIHLRMSLVHSYDFMLHKLILASNVHWNTHSLFLPDHQKYIMLLSRISLVLLATSATISPFASAQGLRKSNISDSKLQISAEEAHAPVPVHKKSFPLLSSLFGTRDNKDDRHLSTSIHYSQMGIDIDGQLTDDGLGKLKFDYYYNKYQSVFY